MCDGIHALYGLHMDGRVIRLIRLLKTSSFGLYVRPTMFVVSQPGQMSVAVHQRAFFWYHYL